MDIHFELIGEVGDVQIIARGTSIRERASLEAEFGRGRWGKLKVTARVRLRNGWIGLVELHWYEAHGIGRRKLKIKRFLE